MVVLVMLVLVVLVLMVLVLVLGMVLVLVLCLVLVLVLVAKVVLDVEMREDTLPAGGWKRRLGDQGGRGGVGEVRAGSRKT